MFNISQFFLLSSFEIIMIVKLYSFDKFLVDIIPIVVYFVLAIVVFNLVLILGLLIILTRVYRRYKIWFLSLNFARLHMLEHAYGFHVSPMSSYFLNFDKVELNQFLLLFLSSIFFFPLLFSLFPVLLPLIQFFRIFRFLFGRYCGPRHRWRSLLWVENVYIGIFLFKLI